MTPESSGDGNSVALLVILLLGSITAGILLASPLGRRWAARRTAARPPRLAAAKPPADLASTATSAPPERTAPSPAAWSTGPELDDERYRPSP